MENRQDKINRIKEQYKIKCVHMVEDGCGTYCGLKPMTGDYPHKFWRTDCYGRKDNCNFLTLYKENKNDERSERILFF